MDLALKDRKVLVTAASDGIGRGIVEAFCAEKAKVAICARDRQKMEDLKSEIGISFYESCDLTSASSIESFLKLLRDQFGVPEILVINTSGPPKGKFSQLTFEDWTKGFEVVWGPVVKFISAILPQMIERKRGRIVISTSFSAREPIGTMLVSGAMRSGVSNLVKGLAREVAEAGVTVNAVLPGWTASTSVKKMGSNPIDSIVAQIPMKRLAEPREIGDLVAFLCSDRASYITGQAIAIDGGFLHAI